MERLSGMVGEPQRSARPLGATQSDRPGAQFSKLWKYSMLDYRPCHAMAEGERRGNETRPD